jgi:DNA-binding NtrC family response regulator
MDYDYPGNVREVKNILERTVALASGDVVFIESLPAHIINQQVNVSSIRTLAEISFESEKRHIVKTLELTKGNKSKTAQILGINRKTLWEKIKLYNIQKKTDKPGSSS